MNKPLIYFERGSDNGAKRKYKLGLVRYGRISGKPIEAFAHFKPGGRL